jgi:hypothetical protein
MTKYLDKWVDIRTAAKVDTLVCHGCRTRKRPGRNPGPSSFRLSVGLKVHAAHAAHATAWHSRGPTVLPRPFGDHVFRGDQKPGDRRRIPPEQPWLGR